MIFCDQIIDYIEVIAILECFFFTRLLYNHLYNDYTLVIRHTEDGQKKVAEICRLQVCTCWVLNEHAWIWGSGRMLLTGQRAYVSAFLATGCKNASTDHVLSVCLSECRTGEWSVAKLGVVKLW
jgi:hypothetical protein